MAAKFSTTIKASMDAKGLSISDIAGECGVTYEHIRKLVAGSAYPSKLVLREICGMLELDEGEMRQLIATEKWTRKYTVNAKLETDADMGELCVLWKGLDDRGQRDLLLFANSLAKSARSENPTKKGVTYLVKSPTSGMVKIGSTTNLAWRLDRLSYVHKEDLKLLGTIPGLETESALHHRFHEYRRVGEWFEPIGTLAEFIGGLENTSFLPEHKLQA